jgi:hypothetical protein
VLPADTPLLNRKILCTTMAVFLHLSDSMISEFVPGGLNSTIISMSSLHLDPINILQADYKTKNILYHIFLKMLAVLSPEG